MVISSYGSATASATAWAADYLASLPQDLKGKKIAVAMSGGVDSTLAAALLSKRGARVMGFTLQLYPHQTSAESGAGANASAGAGAAQSKTCCAGRDIYDAKQVAAQLGIAHYVLDYQDYFRQNVIDDFVDSYARGETPLPCVRCNERIKFSLLLDYAKGLGADYFATGHYIDKRNTHLYQAADSARDQSYFLWRLTNAQLAFSLFPLGALYKDEIRKLARHLGLLVADKPDSQDICFVPSGHYSDVVSRLRPEVQRAGDILHIDGRVLGRHQGLYRYTIGQRRRLGALSPDPLYVIAIEPKEALLIVGSAQDCLTRSLSLSDMNWIGEDMIDDSTIDGGAINGAEDKQLLVKLRSTHNPLKARLTGKTIILDEPQSGVALGQACVIYDNCGKQKRILGGGWISQTDLNQTIKHILLQSKREECIL